MSGRVIVLGSGSWGIALANVLADGPFAVSIWPPTKEELALLLTNRENPNVLPGIKLAPQISISENPSPTGEPLHILIVVPSHAVRGVMEQFRLPEQPTPGSTVICAAKGIENGTLLRMSEVLHEILPLAWRSRIVALSGPSHAEEVSRGVPTAIVVGSSNISAAGSAQALLARKRFRVYVSDDIIGVELGGEWLRLPGWE